MTPSEADVVRAVQKHLPNVLEARILVSSPQKSVWHSPGSRSDVTGGYEVRRKDWESLRSVTASIRKSDSDANTVYLVRAQPFTNWLLTPINRPFGIPGKTANTRTLCGSNLSFCFIAAQQDKILPL